MKGIKNRRVEKKVNSKLKTLAYFKPFAEEQISHSINENDILDYSYYGTFEVMFFKNNILILSLTGYYYPLGAAHGLSSKITPVTVLSSAIISSTVLILHSLLNYLLASIISAKA